MKQKGMGRGRKEDGREGRRIGASMKGEGKERRLRKGMTDVGRRDKRGAA